MVTTEVTEINKLCLQGEFNGYLTFCYDFIFHLSNKDCKESKI